MAVVVSDTNHLKPGNVFEVDESAPVVSGGVKLDENRRFEIPFSSF